MEPQKGTGIHVRPTRPGEHTWPLVIKIAGNSPIYVTAREAQDLRDQLQKILAT